MNFKPLISVIIPVYNQAEFVIQAIESVIGQSYRSIELIIVNDGSTDNLKKALKEIKCPYIYVLQDNKGPASARNSGIKVAKGNYIAFLDADDRWPSKRLDLMIPYLEHYSIVMGKVKESNDRSVTLPVFGAALFHKDVFSTVGLLDESLGFSEDQDWFLKAKEENLSLLTLPMIALNKRSHAQSMTYNRTWKELDIHKVLKYSLDRRRKKHLHGIPSLKTLSQYGA